MFSTALFISSTGKKSGRKDEVAVYRVELKVLLPHTSVGVVIRVYFIRKHFLGGYGCVCHIRGVSHEANMRIIKALDRKIPY
jgi:hypothetical protein